MLHNKQKKRGPHFKEIDGERMRALNKAGFQVVLLDQTFKSKWDQAKNDGNTVAATGAWTCTGGRNGHMLSIMEARVILVTSLQLVGPKFSEAEFLNAGRLVEAGVSSQKR